MRRAILTAVRDQLRAALNVGGLALTQSECELMPRSGRPPARCGERFVGVWAGPRETTKPGFGLDEFYTVHVTVTMRTSRVPPDQLGPQLHEKATTGFDDLVDAVRLCIAQDALDCRVLTRANTIVGFTGDDTSPLGFYEPLYSLGDGGNEDVGAAWFSAEGDEEPEGVKCVLRFGRARRTQDLAAGRTLS